MIPKTTFGMCQDASRDTPHARLDIVSGAWDDLVVGVVPMRVPSERVEAMPQILLTDDQVADIQAAMFTEHETMVLGGLCYRELIGCKKSAQTVDNYLWSNSEGAGATWSRLLEKVNPDLHKKFIKKEGDPYSWRRTMTVPVA